MYSLDSTISTTVCEKSVSFLKTVQLVGLSALVVVRTLWRSLMMLLPEKGQDLSAEQKCLTKIVTLLS